jgi:hypothetical protein
MNKRISESELIAELVFSFVRAHRYSVSVPGLLEIGCRAGPDGAPTKAQWTQELNRCSVSLREAIHNALDEHEMYLMMGEFDTDARTPPPPPVDESWVQLCQGTK